MIYGVDVDGVLAATTEAVIDYFDDMYGHPLRMADITSFRWEEWCPDRWVVDEVIQLFGCEAFYEGLEPLAGALDGVRTFQAFSRQVVAITARPAHCKEATEDWLMAWGFDVRRVVCTHDKVAAAKHHGVKIMVEDAPHHAQALANADLQVYLIDYPWNRSLPAHPLIHRVSGWPEIIARESESYRLHPERIGSPQALFAARPCLLP